MKHKSSILIFTLLILAFSCKKDECKNPDIVDVINITELPPATMTGANTMGCLINGEVWLPLSTNILGDLVYDITFSVTGPDQGGGISIQSRKTLEDYDDILLVAASNVLEPGIFPSAIFGNQYFTAENSCGYFETDTTYLNFVEITKIDFDEEIVSGLFQMRVINENCDTLTMTEGRFDLSP